VATMPEAATSRRQSNLWSEPPNAGKIARPHPPSASDERSSVGSQYEETNRYVLSFVTAREAILIIIFQIAWGTVSKSKKAKGRRW
jgi:hypothetical protein